MIRPQNLDPLVKDKLAVIATYKKLKNLGPDWTAKHAARGIVYAETLLKGVGPQGGQLERAIGLLEWLKAQGKDFDMGSALTFFGEYQRHLERVQASTRSRCKVCGCQFDGQGKLCPNHSWVTEQDLKGL